MSTQQSEQRGETSQQQRADSSRERGKQIMVEPEDIDVMNFKPEDFGKPLDLKVYRKWISKNIPYPNPMGICFILLDKKGGVIQASGQLPDMRQLDTKLQLDACYRIQGYGCKRTDNWQRTLDNKITLLFGRFTQAAPIQDEGFPEHYFNFTPYNEVCRRADTREPILTDYVGILRNIGTIREFGDATNNIISRRNIDMQNLNGNTVMLTLWNDLATDFPIARVEEMEQPVVIAASSCWAKRHAGIIQLSSTPTTSIYLNPPVPTAEHIQEVYKELLGSAPPMQLLPSEGTSSQPRVRPQTMTLVAIMGSAMQNTMQHFLTDAIIIKIDDSKGCYCFRATLADVTGSIVVACYSPAAHSLVPNITKLLSYVPDRDPYTLPPIIKDLENTKRRFQIHLGKGSRRGYPKFILDNAAEISPPASPETYIEAEAETLSTPTSNMASEQQPTEITPGSASPPRSTSTPTEIVLRITAAETESPIHVLQALTPASPTESADTSAQVVPTTAIPEPETTVGNEEQNRPPLRRELFVESDEDGNDESSKKARHD
ncbi:nucleic acid-binding, OB-fold protein [Artemisia annua]|uniref:Nucleic acid-binding, OB-fold protein n=1 Tax=Artemisia annua TaxID=35608 RepID=A0A2U1LYA6_ARTAN|nr:nucleic acid-binding, OB-fold protein [Artemisia annua]